MADSSWLPEKTFHERYIPALDGIRGIAILAVLLHHFRFLLNARFPAQFSLLRLFDLGWCGVILFFVLSGFLITGILLDSRTSASYFSTFYARRFLRIFPLYYVYLAVVFLCAKCLHDWFGTANPLAQISPWWYLAYVQNLRPNTMLVDPYLGHLWSLAVEEQFYLVWPLLVWLLDRRALAWVSAALIPLSLSVRLYYAGHTLELNAFVNTFTPACLDSLASGALIALAVRSVAWRRRLRPLARPFLLLCAIWFLILAWRAGSFFIYVIPMQTWGTTALTLMFAALVFIGATSTRGAINRILTLRGLRFTGKVSYGLYVWHPIVFGLVLQVFSAVPAPAALDFVLNGEKIVIVLFASIAVAALSWVYFEKPILALKKRFPYREVERPLRVNDEQLDNAALSS